MVAVLLGILGLLLLYYVFFLVKDLIANKANLGKGSLPVAFGIGFVTDFLDVLGIGSFAPTTMLLQMTKYLDDDKKLPGTLNVAHTIPVMIEAFIMIKVVKVAPLTLLSLVFAAIIGSFVGSKTVTKLPEKKVQFYVGLALVATAFIMGAKQMGWLAMLGDGNTATALTGGKLIIGIVGNFIFGALMTIGVGLYAPCMAMVYLLGLQPIVAMPIMMASCAGLMPVASAEFIKTGDYSRKAVIGITIGGIIGVIIAANVVTNIPMDILTWIIICVIIYTGITYIMKSKKNIA
ncbi:sulfite exporter TauE/SafE family protein [Vagococcus hydrophili]|uniref:Permease n=1 Tax=Vagococcus hydrophili TaxID=2714947 RepID=A0A6G8AV03_9ENTE|nr:sulfite exporter TauE/SafE family protein [Vagococcus hydrophili]QIL48782.1 permease [Vagococcus hydrophili]